MARSANEAIEFLIADRPDRSTVLVEELVQRTLHIGPRCSAQELEDRHGQAGSLHLVRSLRTRVAPRIPRSLSTA